VAEKVTVGLSSQWLCITHLVAYPPTDSVAIEREMSTPYTPDGHSTLYLFTL